jgi:hypothetical protein
LSDFQEKAMKWTTLTMLVLRDLAMVVVLGTTWQAQAQGAKSPYPSMAPLEHYLMERNAEIALARSAAPESISRDAEVMVLGRHGYETAVNGKNGFVCMVERSWTAGIDDPDFWNPKLRGPICFNPPGARSYLPLTIKKTEWILAGRSKAEMFADLQAAFDKKEMPPLESNAMCFMMSKQAYLSDRDRSWHPHLMIFTPITDPAVWGAGLAGTPVIGVKDTEDRLNVFLIPVGRWSDGTVAPVYEPPAPNPVK